MLAIFTALGMMFTTAVAVDCDRKLNGETSYTACKEVFKQYDIKYEYPTAKYR